MHLFCIYAFGFFFSIHFSTFYKIYAQAELDDHSLTIAGMVGAIATSGSKVLWGILFDKYGFKKVYGGVMMV